MAWFSTVLFKQIELTLTASVVQTVKRAIFLPDQRMLSLLSDFILTSLFKKKIKTNWFFCFSQWPQLVWFKITC